MKINKLSTEAFNKKTEKIDSVSNLEKLKLINAQDKTVATNVGKKLEEIEKFVTAATKVVKNGGRVIYVGAGTSGRLGILDASEILPTYGDGKSFVGIIAGGKKAVIFPVENAEDNEDQAVKDLKEIKFTKKDILLGIAASGRTPYVISALKHAKKIGALTGSLSTTTNAAITKIAKYPIEIHVGPETIVGSTRMKSGTAQKLVLNMISTAVMVNLGKVYKNLMVDVVATNEKLRIRSINMLMGIIGVTEKEAAELLSKSGHSVKVAVVMHEQKCSKTKAIKLLKENDNKIRGLLSNQ